MTAVTISVDASCTACGLCVITCPTGALARAPFRPLPDPARCTECLECIEVCPRDAVHVVAAGRAQEPRS